MCTVKSPTEANDFVSEVVDLAIRLKNDQPLELSTLSDSLVSELPVDSVETLILAEELKRKGFTVVDWGRGNFLPNGVRIVTLRLVKDDCQCTINKMYYSTVEDNMYQIREAISCKANFIKQQNK
jgi:hypothetical protein